MLKMQWLTDHDDRLVATWIHSNVSGPSHDNADRPPGSRSVGLRGSRSGTLHKDSSTTWDLKWRFQNG